MPFAIALLAHCVTKRTPFLWLLTGIAVVLCPVLLVESINPHSMLFFRNIGAMLYLPPGNLVCGSEMSPLVVSPSCRDNLRAQTLPAGTYRIEGATAAIELDLFNHPLTPDIYYRILLEGKQVLIEVPAEIVETGSDGHAHHRAAPTGDDIIRPLPRVLSYVGRWPRLLFMLQRFWQ